MKPGPATRIEQTLDQLFRRETGRLVAILARRLGPGRLALAEDIAQDALVAAARTWPYQGVPDNPTAWLHRVAMNRLIDRLRRTATANELPDADLDILPDTERPETPGIGDTELQLIFLCCHPDLAEQDRLALTLNSALGFTSREVAGLFLVPAPTMAQRLTRVKARIKRDGLSLGWPLPADLKARLDSVHKVIYLAFALAYSPKSGQDAVHRDAALEALRPARALTEMPLTDTADSDALAALLCFQSSRLECRTDTSGRFVRLADQDRTGWDQTLIALGFRHLMRAKRADRLSRYHLEAGIAAAHAAAPDWPLTDWAGICAQYEILEAMTGCPIVALNHAVAIAIKGDAKAALAKLAGLAGDRALSELGHYHAARAEILLECGDKAAAAADFRLALQRAGSAPELAHLESRLSLCL